MTTPLLPYLTLFLFVIIIQGACTLQGLRRQSTTTGISNRFVSALPVSNRDQYATYWENLLSAEYQEKAADLRERRSTWSRSRLENSGLSVFGVFAEADSELYGEKLVRVSYYRRGGDDNRRRRLEDIFSRGDILIMTPQQQIRGETIPRECCVVDSGKDWLTVGVGATWPAGLWEKRRGLLGSFPVRLDRAAPKGALHAQQKSLQLVRRNQAGTAAAMLADTFRNPTMMDYWSSTHTSSEEFRSPYSKETIQMALEKAKKRTSFRPNQFQEEIIIWALGRRMALVRGPPGTGKTRTAALLVSTAIQLSQENNRSKSSISSPRVLAVAHSNGAADVLLEALLQMGVPAVRVGRPASISPSVRHRTVAAILEKHPEVLRLREETKDVVSLDNNHVRLAARMELKRCIDEVQKSIYKTAPVVVTSCIGAHQLLQLGDEQQSGGKESVKQQEEEREREEASFPIVVLDEAAQTTEPALVCALAAAKAQQVIFVGDSRQLGPTVASGTSELRDGLGLSPMLRLEKTGLEEKSLIVQYRMPPALVEHPSQYFYDGMITSVNGNSILPPPGFPWPRAEPLAFVPVGKNLEVTHEFSGKSNPTEASLVGQIVSSLVLSSTVVNNNKNENQEVQRPAAPKIAVITPYSKQVQCIRAELARRKLMNDDKNIRVGTVDSFQGQETDVVIFSAVRSNPALELGFLRDPRRLCVAITRARRGLIILGDEKVLQTSRHWAALVDFLQKRGSFMDPKELELELKLLANDNDNDRNNKKKKVERTMDAEIEKFFQ